MFLTDRVSVSAPRRTADGYIVADAYVARTGMSAIPLIDAQAALGFVVAQASIIEPGVYRTIYPDVHYRTLVPVDTSAACRGLTGAKHED